MDFDWADYVPEDAMLIDQWLDEAAVAMTGIDTGWDRYWNDVIADAVNYPGCLDCCKVVKKDGIPMAAVVFGCYRGIAVISEIVVDPARRAEGYGTQIIRELVMNADAWLDEKIHHFCAVVFPSNVPSQKAFRNAGFVLRNDQDASVFEYIYHM